MNRPRRRPTAVLVGMPGAGKSTIGRKLARALGAKFVDTDAAIESTTGSTIPELFEQGESVFREVEEQVVAQALSRSGVIALGGGAVKSAKTRQRLRNHTVVFLDISVSEGVRRTAKGGRPLLEGVNPAQRFRELYAERAPLYAEVATITVPTDRRNPSKVVAQIRRELDGKQPERNRPRPQSPRQKLSPR